MFDIFNRMSYKGKNTFFLLLVNIIVAIIILSTTQIVTKKIIEEKTVKLAMNQINIVNANLENILEDYINLNKLMIGDSAIQTYLQNKNIPIESENVMEIRAQETLIEVYNLKNITYIALVGDDGRKVTSVGTTSPASKKDIYEYGYEVYRDSLKINASNMQFNISYDRISKRQSLIICQPIISNINIKKQIGIVLISIESKQIEEKLGNKEYSDLNIVIFDSESNVLVGDLNNDRVDIAKYFDKSDFTTKISGDLFFFSYLKDWNLYLVAEIPEKLLHEDSNRLILLFSIIMLVVVCPILAFVSIQFNNVLYRPLRGLIRCMASVSRGDLDVKLPEYKEKDLKLIANGFNNMTMEINNLLNQIKLEEEQLKEVELSALQAQIKPHFLYNILESFHWKSLEAGDLELSSLIKTLAKYYRNCLSSGKDVITLADEIKHIENYVLLQNFRFENVIKLNIDIDPSCEFVLLPKMTMQPLIENCIYHGIISKKGKQGIINITTKKKDGDTTVVISDNGQGMPDHEILYLNQSLSHYNDSKGYGVRNVHKRLEILFGKGYGLCFKKNIPQGISVEIKLRYISKETYNV